MPQKSVDKLEDSLFSLELVVEKVYIPHTPCRFPAIAFRLLDFPTIVIKHVDDELGKAVRRKISFDPYYQLPDQFAELKDRHGNFMVNKGKSCLFRIAPDIFKQHLTNTPLYVMIIDLFPEVPKLVGNSSVPLNTLMDSICMDIVKLGSTVPTVHGDKGLFKLYNLMGKEIGYFVLGFRLLCLGPSLILHLPEPVLIHQRSKGKAARDDKHIDELIHKRLSNEGDVDDSEESEIELRNSACMTDPIKHDVLLQTVEMENKATHIMVSDIDNHLQRRQEPVKASSSMSTQTERRKRVKEAQNEQQKWAELVEHKLDDDNCDIIINNIICPPPLFYNSKALPVIKINRQLAPQELLEECVDDLSDVASYDGQGLEKINKKPVLENDQQDLSKQPQVVPFQSEKDYRYPVLPIPQVRAGETVHGLQVAPNSATVFPLLTALIQELSCIQNPQFLLNVSNRMQATSMNLQKSQPSLEDKTYKIEKADKLSPAVVSAVAAALTKKLENSEENKIVAKSEQSTRPKFSNLSSVPQTKNLLNLKDQKPSSAQHPIKRKLVYGITNTQRLRLQKANPQWLKEVEKQASEVKTKRQPVHKRLEVIDVNATTFSDTLTQVRQMAEKELNIIGAADALQGVVGESLQSESNQDFNNTSRKPQKTKGSPVVRKFKLEESSSRFSTRKSVQKTQSAKVRSRTDHGLLLKEDEQVESFAEADEMGRRPVPHMRHMKNISSPSGDKQEPIVEGTDGLVSPDQLSSKSRSLEIHLPSHDLDDSAMYAGDSDEDEEIPLPDDSFTDKGRSSSLSFPRYISKDASLPESIAGTANASLNVSGALDDNSPLESTRQSKFVTSEQPDSKVIQSTDYDSHQFQSTDEPELQDLASEEESHPDAVDSGRRSVASMRASEKFPMINPQLSENSPVPSIRRSTNKQDPSAQSYLPLLSNEPASSATSTLSSIKDSRIKQSNPSNIHAQVPSLTRNDFTTRANITPRSTSSSPRRPTPQPRRPAHESIHTDSLSSYMPSDPDNVIVSLSSNSGSYSDELLLHKLSKPTLSGNQQPPKLIPSSKLGYTIH